MSKMTITFRSWRKKQLAWQALSVLKDAGILPGDFGLSWGTNAPNKITLSVGNDKKGEQGL
jgi:hypothetical protein